MQPSKLIIAPAVVAVLLLSSCATQSAPNEPMDTIHSWSEETEILREEAVAARAEQAKADAEKKAEEEKAAAEQQAAEAAEDQAPTDTQAPADGATNSSSGGGGGASGSNGNSSGGGSSGKGTSSGGGQSSGGSSQVPQQSNPAPQPAPAAPAPAPAPAPPAQVSGNNNGAQRMVELVNAERSRNGLGPVSLSGSLQSAAANHSADQARSGRVSHQGSDGSSLDTRLTRAGFNGWTYGENVASGYGSADSVFGGWMNSSGHRANILNPDFTVMGLGSASSNGTTYWTQVFGA